MALISMHSARSIVAILAASLAAGLGILFPPLWVLAPLGLALFFYELFFTTTTKRRAAVQGLLFGFATGAAGVWWMWDMLPIILPAGMSPATQIIVAGSVWAVTALIAGTTTALAALLIYVLRTNRLVPIIVGIVWLLQEEARMWGYALFSYSPQSLFGPHFSQTALAYTLAENQYLLGLARFGGIAGMSIVVALLAAALAMGTRAALVRQFSRVTGIALALAVLALALPALPRTERVITPLRVSVLSFAAERDAPTLYTLLKDVASSTPDMVLIPESSTFEVFFPDPTERKNVMGLLFGKRDGLVVSAGYEHEGTTTQSVLSYTDSFGKRVASYEKMFLMPQGEYYPTISLPLFSLSGDPNIRTYTKDAGERLSRGDGFVVQPFKGNVIGGLICSELLSPSMYEKLVGTFGANILVNLANPSWFHESRSYFDKTIEIAKVHAVENGAPVFVANTGTPSFVIDAHGRLIGETPWGVDGILSVDIGT